MLIRTNRCQSQCVRASSMVCSSVQTDKAQAHHSFPKRDCSSISSEKACLWDINYWEKRVLLRPKQDSYCLFFFCFGLGRSMTVHLHWFPVISYAVIVHKEKRMRTGIDSNSDRFYASASQSSAAAPEPHRTNVSLLWIMGSAALSNRCCQSLNYVVVCW